MSDTVYLVVTSAFVLAGDIVTEGDVVEVTNAEARDLLNRGKARPATEEDGAPAGEPEDDEQPEATEEHEAEPIGEADK